MARAVVFLVFLLGIWTGICFGQESLEDTPCQLGNEAIAGLLDPILHRVYPANAGVFDLVFEVWMTNSVDARWSQADLDWFALNIMDNDSTNTSNDLFAMVWDYFCIAGVGDLNPSYAGVKFWPVGQGGPYTTIKISLYSPQDFPVPCPYSDTLCGGNATVYANEIFLNATYSSPWQARGHFAHEFQHLCWRANGLTELAGYDNANETLATLAEHFSGVPRIVANYPYDSSVLRWETCDQNSKYQTERIWITYLYETVKGGAGMSDDVIFRWIRDLTPTSDRMKLISLAETLWDPAYSTASWAGGANATERLHNVFQHFAVAKFANASDFAPNGRFGIGSTNSVLDFHFFEDNSSICCVGPTPTCWDKTPMVPVDCPNWGVSNQPIYPAANNCTWNVRILPPAYELGSSHNNTTTATPSIYIDLDTSRDGIDVSEYGTDYIIFRSGSYFENGAEHELRITLNGGPEDPLPSRALTPFAWVLGYCCEEASLQTHPEDLLFAEPVQISAGAATITVTDFGRGVRAVVLVVGAVSQHPERFGFVEWPINRFIYQYTYRVETRTTQSVTWDGDVFVLGDITVPSTGSLKIKGNVKVSNSDLGHTGDISRVEIKVNGSLVVNGTAAKPVTIRSWTPTTSADWVGFYFSTASSSGTFKFCEISDAELAIDSYKPITLRSATISGASDALVSITNSTLTTDASSIRTTNGDGILLTNSSATIDSTTVEDCAGSGLYLSGNRALNITRSEFLDNDVGVYVENNSTNGTISETRFDGNVDGVSYYNSTKPDIDECVITGNTHGIELDHYSWPTILHCIDSATYDGDITGNGSGIGCTDHSDPVIGSCNISSNNTGVFASDDSEPSLEGNGANKLQSNSVYHVANLSPSVTIAAQGNYWYKNTGSPNYSPKASKILGTVDYTGALSDAPNPVFPRPEPKPEPEGVVTGLGRAHPNPFNPTIQIPYGVASPTDVQIDVFDVGGRLVRTLVSDRKERGNHVVVWDGTTNGGDPTASAVYFVRLRAGRLTETQKIVLLK